jgi:hypothetical protein
MKKFIFCILIFIIHIGCKPNLKINNTYKLKTKFKKEPLALSTIKIYQDSTYILYRFRGYNEINKKYYGIEYGKWNLTNKKTLHLAPYPNYVKFNKNFQSYDIKDPSLRILNFNELKKQYNISVIINDEIVKNVNHEIMTFGPNKNINSIQLQLQSNNPFDSTLRIKLFSEKVNLKNINATINLELEDFIYRFRYSENPVDTLNFKLGRNFFKDSKNNKYKLVRTLK